MDISLPFLMSKYVPAVVSMKYIGFDDVITTESDYFVCENGE